MTVNVVVFDNELDQLRQIIDAAKAAGISAIIASDISAIMYARQVGVEVHISTQVNITNIEAVRFYSQFADVVVLAREMNIGRVWEISRQIREENIYGAFRRIGAGSKCLYTEPCAWPFQENVTSASTR